MSGIIQGVNVNTASIETLNNVFRTELGRLGVQTTGNESYRGLVDLLGGMTVKSGRNMILVDGSINYPAWTPNNAGGSVRT